MFAVAADYYQNLPSFSAYLKMQYYSDERATL
jgi:hypothetical protein